jgi:tetratricopeptide (TPR) repeat protein
MEPKEDPIKLHKDANLLYESEKYEEAAEVFLQSAELYQKKGNSFDSSNMLYKAGECSFMLKDFETAIERFQKSADLAFSKGFDRFGVSGLEYILDCFKGLKKEKTKAAKDLQKRIKDVKDKLAKQYF